MPAFPSNVSSKDRLFSSRMFAFLLLALGVNSAIHAQGLELEIAAKGSAIDARPLTPAEIDFVNNGAPAVARRQQVLTYPEYPDNALFPMGGRMAARDDGSTFRILVTLRPAVSRGAGFAAQAESALSRAEEVRQALAGSTARIIKEFSDIPVLVVEADLQTVTQLSTLDAVAGLEIDQTLQPYHASSMQVIDARDLQLHSTTGAGFNGGGGSWGVAVLDNGIRTSHQALTGRVVAEACFVSDNSCPNGQNTMIGAGAASNCGAPGGRCAHGTHVAGTSAGEFTATGLLTQDGVAPGADIYGIQVFDAQGQFTFFSDVIEGLEHVNSLVLNGARIASANMSLGSFEQFSGNCDLLAPAFVTAASILRNNGVMVVAAAGNASQTSSMGMPACLSPVVAVGNTQDNDFVYSSSSASSELDLWAPGADITSSVDGSDTDLARYWGTSMSAPHVAGAAAMLRECYVSPGSSASSATQDDIILNHMISTGVLVTDQRVFNGVTRPRLDLGAAALAIRPNDLFSQAISIGSTSGNYLGQNTCSTTEPSEPSHNGSDATTGSVWYTFPVASTGIYTFTTCDAATGFDTVLAAYTGSSVSSLVQLQSNDDDSSCANSTLQSTVSVNANSGETIKVAVSGYGPPNEFGSTGVFNLKWSYQETTCNGLPVDILGTDASETINGTNASEVIMGLGGIDTINGMGGNDTICGGDGNDIIDAGPGEDWVDGQNGEDTIKGGPDDDTLYGGNDIDTIRGSRGNDYIDGGAGNDIIDGGVGDDEIKGGPDDDEIYGNLGDDLLRGSRGNDIINGAEGEDEIYGGWGDDNLKGGPDNDILDGGLGMDTLRGSRGDDELDGGEGNDTLHGGVQDFQDTCVSDVDDVAVPVDCEVIL